MKNLNKLNHMIIYTKKIQSGIKEIIFCLLVFFYKRIICSLANYIMNNNTTNSESKIKNFFLKPVFHRGNCLNANFLQ